MRLNSQSRVKGFSFVYLNMLLAGSLLIAGVGIKIVLLHATDELHAAEAYLLCCSVGCALGIIQAIRYTHKAGFLNTLGGEDDMVRAPNSLHAVRVVSDPVCLCVCVCVCVCVCGSLVNGGPSCSMLRSSLLASSLRWASCSTTFLLWVRHLGCRCYGSGVGALVCGWVYFR